MLFFGEKRGDPLMDKIYLREVAARATEWEHPAYGIVEFLKAKQAAGDWLKTSKRTREVYALSICAASLRQDTRRDWWVAPSETDSSDGILITESPVTDGVFKGLMRDCEVVEHRDRSISLYDRLRQKLYEKTYGENQALICLMLTPGL